MGLFRQKKENYSKKTKKQKTFLIFCFFLEMPTNRTEDGNDFFLQNASNMKNEKCCSSLKFGNQIFLLLPLSRYLLTKKLNLKQLLKNTNYVGIMMFQFKDFLLIWLAQIRIKILQEKVR